VSTTGNTTACRGTTGIGATVIRTAINDDGLESRVSLTILVGIAMGPVIREWKEERFTRSKRLNHLGMTQRV
jgi:hypothetical protein